MKFSGGMFRTVLIGGTLIVTGLIAGLIVSSRMDWASVGNGDQAVKSVHPEAVERAAGSSPAPAEQPFIGIVEAATPAVVNISTTRLIRQGPGGPQSPFPNDPFFRRFFGDEFFRQFEGPRERREQSLGSGVIVDSTGYIITNNHVVEQADEIKVLLMDKREFNGKVVGSDPKTDLAVIKVDAKNLPTIGWGDSDSLRVGEYVLAIGNPFGLNQTVTMGIISAVGRAQVGIADYEDFIQTDAAINPGNSGGALINIRGELIGINTAIFSRSGGYMGIGFAVPSRMARSIMQSLVDTGKVVRGWLGVSIQDINHDLAREFGLEHLKGALVGDVMEDSPADKAGVKPGDVIMAYGGTGVDGPTQLRNMVAQSPAGRNVQIEVFRSGASRTIHVIIGEMPAEGAREGMVNPETGKRAVLGGLEVTGWTSELAKRFGLPDTVRGVIIIGVQQGSPADQAGLQAGDMIIEMNHQSVPGLNDFNKAASKIKGGDAVLLLVSREGRKMFVVIRP